MKKNFSIIFLILFFLNANAQTDTTHKVEAPKPVVKEDKALKYNLNDDGSHWFQVTFLNQTWLRENRSNPGTTVLGDGAPSTFDIGLRRTRIQMFGQITDRAFLYFPAGQNNFNFLYNGQGANNRIVSFYIHDALCEYRLTKKAQLKIGGGLTIANGLSRFSNPSVGTIMALDVPVFAQATVNQTDLFSRKLSVYARGQIGKLDYRLVLSDPFPVNTAGSLAPGTAAPTKPLSSANYNSTAANFAFVGHNLQYQGYFMWQFFEHEGHNTPYMTGTYLGKKKIFNVAAGVIYQPKATWRFADTSAAAPIVYDDMLLIAAETFLDTYINKEKGNGVTAYLGYFNLNYGKNYVRTQAQMNPADNKVGANSPFTKSISGGGNGWPMWGTGQVVYAQAGYLFKKDMLGSHGTIQPYACYQRNMYQALADPVNVYDLGLNWLMNGHKSKLSFDYQNRPVYNNIPVADPSGVKPGVSGRRGCFILQYQIYI
jgi:hypothetical protein